MSLQDVLFKIKLYNELNKEQYVINPNVYKKHRKIKLKVVKCI